MSGPRVWAGGSTVYTQGETVISSLDWMDYRKIATSGTDTLDPADDIVKYVSANYRRITAIPALNINNANNVIGIFANGSTLVAPGTIALGARTEILTSTGRGIFNFLGMQKNTLSGGRIEIIVDGRAIFDQSLGSASTEVQILIGIPAGQTVSSTYYPAYNAIPDTEGIPFFRSFRVFYTPAGQATNANSRLAYMTKAMT